MTRPSRFSSSLVGVLGIGLATAGAQVPIVSISSGFGEQPPPWQVLLIRSQNAPLSSNASIPPTGGNPGAAADLRVALPALSPAAGAGFLFDGFPRTFRTPPNIADFSVRIRADYRVLTAPSSTAPLPPDLMLVLTPLVVVDQTRTYSVVNGIPLDQAAPSWTTLSEGSFSATDFRNSSGIPLAGGQSFRVGFAAMLRSATTPSADVSEARVLIDNISIVVIPSPPAAALAMLGAVAALRRRRPSR